MQMEVACLARSGRKERVTRCTVLYILYCTVVVVPCCLWCDMRAVERCYSTTIIAKAAWRGRAPVM